jgi:hypothetical protein
MKHLFILLSLVSFNAMAFEYQCEIGPNEMEFKFGAAPAVEVVETASDKKVFSGEAMEVSEQDGVTRFMFETQLNSYMVVSFSSADLVAKPEEMTGYAKGVLGQGYVGDSVQCYRTL